MSEKKLPYLATLELPDTPAIEPCSKEVGVEVAAFYRDGIACRSCRHWLIEVTTMGDSEPRYIHDRKIPPEISASHSASWILGWLEHQFFNSLIARDTWSRKEILEKFQTAQIDLLYEILDRPDQKMEEQHDSAKSANQED